MLEHRQDIRAAPAPGMLTAVEDTVKVDRVHLPACGHGRDILVQASNKRHVSGSRLGGDARVGNAKSSMLQDARPQERRQRPWLEVCVGLGVGLGMRLQSLVGA